MEVSFDEVGPRLGWNAIDLKVVVAATSLRGKLRGNC